MAAKNHTEMKEQNIRKILRTLARNEESSRTALCEQTGLTPSTVSTLTHELLINDFIEEVMTKRPFNGRGRPPINLRLKGNSHAALGLEITPTQVKLGVMSLTGHLLNSYTENVKADPDNIFLIVQNFYKEQSEILAAQNITVAGLGIAVSGLVDTERAIGRYSSNLGWANIDFKNYLRGIDVPIVIDNNVRFMALGEQWYGRSHDFSSLIFIQAGVGVGCAILVEEYGLIKGDNNNAGELGHCTILPHGPKCKCGKRGCLEALVSKNAIISTFTKRAIAKQYSNPYISLEEIVKLAEVSDLVATDVLREAAIYLGIGISNLVNVFDVTRIILNGNAFIMSPLVQTWLHESVKEHQLSSDNPVEFYQCSFKDLQAVVGACTAVLVKRFF